MKTAAYHTLYSVGLLVVLVAGFQGLIDFVGREHVVTNILLSPLAMFAVYFMYDVIFNFVEQNQFKEVLEPAKALKDNSVMLQSPNETTSHEIYPAYFKSR